MTNQFEDIQSIDTKTLNEYYRNLLVEYRRNVNTKWHLTVPDIDDAMNIAYVRDEIQDLINEFKKRSVSITRSELNSIDNDWRNWILKCIERGEVTSPLYEDSTEPDEKWWFHIESLDKIKF